MSSIFNGNNECSLTSISSNGAHLKETLRNHNHQLTPATDLIVTATATTQVTASLITYATTVTTTTASATIPLATTTNLESLPTSTNQNNLRMGLLNNNSVKDAMTHKVLLIKPNSKTDKADQINLVSLSLTPSINSLSFVNNCSLTDTRNGNNSVELSNDLVPLQKDLTKIISTATTTVTLSTSVTTTPSFVSPPFQTTRNSLSLTSVPSIISSLQPSSNLSSLQTPDTLVTPDNTMLTSKINQLNDYKKERRSTPNSSTKMELSKSEKNVLSRDVYDTCIVEKTSVVVDNSYLTQQLLLEKQAKNILDRLKEVQAKQINMHLNKQLKAFLKYEQIRNNIDCQYETRKTDERSFCSNSGNINNTNINSNLCSYIVKTPTAEEQMKLLSPEDVKNLSTAALVNLVKSLNSAVDQHQSIASTISSSSLPSSSSLSSFSSSVQPITLQQHHHYQNFTLMSDKEETEKSKIKNDNFKSDNNNIASGFNQQTDEIKNEMLTSCAILKNNLKHFECTYDSDATESSSGGESCDEENECSNGKQGHTSGSNISIPIDKRAFWKWSVERAAIASRWTWLQAQVADLEFKIRQQNEMYRTLRANKGTITFSATNLNPREHAHTSQSSSLPTSSLFSSSSSNLPAGATTSTAETNNIVTDQSSEGDIPNCVRTLPLKQMRKRKLVRSMNALAGATRKIARYSTVQCKCNSLPYFVSPCVLCNGRYGYIQVIDTDCMPYYERVALLDSSCHSVLSLPNDVSLGLHFSKILKREKSQQVTSRQQYKKKETFSVESQYHFNTDSKKGKKAQIVLPSSKCKKKIDGNIKRKHAKSTSEEQNFNKRSSGKGKEALENANGSGDSKYDSPVASPYAGDVNSSAPLSRRRRSEQHAYDINNIVIPYSIASTTRVEKLEYKEIITPKWRVVDFNDEKSIRASESLEIKLEQPTSISEEISAPEPTSSDKEITESTANSVLTTEEIEDLSDEVFAIRHQKCEIDERKRFGSILNKTKTNPKGPGRGRWSRTRLDSNRSDTATSSINNGPSGDSVNNIDSSSQDSFASTQEMKSKETNSEIIHGTPARTSDRHRTSSSSKREDSIEEEHYVEVTPFEKRLFPLPDSVYEELLKASKLEEEEEEKKEEQRRVLQQESNDEIVTPTETSNKVSMEKEAPKSPENIAESSIPASPNESDCSSSVADNDVDIDDMSADPEWEPKKV